VRTQPNPRFGEVYTQVTMSHVINYHAPQLGNGRWVDIIDDILVSPKSTNIPFYHLSQPSPRETKDI
jgi:adenine/guanine phosphoribosyltransferase-like PRPP-binding protein